MEFKFKRNYYIECPDELVDCVVRAVRESYEKSFVDIIRVVSGADNSDDFDWQGYLKKNENKLTRVYMFTHLTPEQADSQFVKCGILMGRHNNLAMVIINGHTFLEEGIFGNMDYRLRASIKDDAIVFGELPLSGSMPPCPAH